MIDLSGPDITRAEIEAVTAVLHTGRLSLGPKVEEFEEAVAGFVGVEHGVAVSSGTAGLHLLTRAVGVEPCATSPTGWKTTSTTTLSSRIVDSQRFGRW